MSLSVILLFELMDGRHPRRAAVPLMAGTTARRRTRNTNSQRLAHTGYHGALVDGDDKVPASDMCRTLGGVSVRPLCFNQVKLPKNENDSTVCLRTTFYF